MHTKCIDSYNVIRFVIARSLVLGFIISRCFVIVFIVDIFMDYHFKKD